MRLDLRYGDGERALMLPTETDVRSLDPQSAAVASDPAALLTAAFASPVGSAALSELLSPRTKVLVVVSDPTRGGVREMLPVTMAALESMGVAAANTSVLVARGTHRALTRAERKFLKSPMLRGVRVVEHDCDDAESMSALLLTRRGTPLRISREIRSADLVVLLSGISFHYFAGFGGGRKLILPGCSDRASIMANHRLSLTAETPVRLNTACRPGNLEKNPVHDDMCEAIAALKGLFAVNFITDVDGRVIWVNAGAPVPSHAAACGACDDMWRVSIPARARVVVASAGGKPFDINLLQSHKAIYHACAALEDGGTLLLYAECEEGAGSESLVAALSLPREIFLAQAHETYALNNQTAVSLIGLTARCRVGMVTALDRELLALAGIIPVNNAEAFLAEALDAGGGNQVVVVRHASRVLPSVAGS